MNRRSFLGSSSLAGVALITNPTATLRGNAPRALERIGLTTVVFRDRFKSSVSKGISLTNELTLLDVPAYFNDRFKIRNVEAWGKHFDSKDPDYLNELKKNLKKNKSQLVDIQATSKFDISDPEAENREDALREMKEWIDVAVALNCPSVRFSRMKKSYDVAISSIKSINDYAAKKGVNTLVENHFDLFSDPKIHLQTFEDVASENFGILADFGNYPETVDRYKALEMIAPVTTFVSAKTGEFDAGMEHVSFDFGRCMDIMENAGFKGIYSLEQWGGPNEEYDYEEIVDWMILQVKNRIKS